MNTRDREQILKDIELSKSLLSDKEAAELLEIKLKTLYNRVSNGGLQGLYTISPVNGRRFWYKTKILGI